MRNIVLITLDSLRADHCSFMGYKRKTTPTIDKMARNGLYFENAITSSLRTRQSMFAVFTGNYLLDYSSSNGPEPGDLKNETRQEFKKHKTLAQVLSEKGYDTAAFHANPWVSRLYGFNKGFSQFQDLVSKKNTSFLENVRIMIKKESALTDWNKIYYHVVNWLAKAKKPYFLWILLLDTHLPYIAPKKHRKFGNKFTPYLFYLNWKIRKSMFASTEIISSKERKEIINAYDDSICYADKFVDKLWLDLKDDDPIFIIHADHGDAFGEHGFYYHPFMLYEELIHVPLVIYNSDSGVKGKVEAPVSLLGMAPAILELVGEENNFFPSKSLLSKDKNWVITKVFDRDHDGKRKIAVRMKDRKFITGQKDIDELYNLEEDPHEQENLINEHPKFVEEMRDIVKNHIKHEMEIRRIRDRALNLKIKNTTE